ncbi:MAG: hypothetical protein AAGL69_17310 [Pseudomonadota bacterium]
MPVSRKLFALTLLTAFIGAVTTAGPSRADDAALADALQCKTIVSDSERLACFDRWALAWAPTTSVAGETSDNVESEPAQDEAVASVKVDPASEEEFGLPPVPLAEDVDRIVTTVTEIDAKRADRIVVTLANEQVWRQTRGTTLRLDVGDEVAIERKLFGAYSLTKSGSSRPMRVKRVR